MIKSIFVKAALFLVLAPITAVHAQTTVEAGLSVGFNRHTFTVDSDNSLLQPGIGLSATYGFPIVVRNSNWELHTGLYENNLSQAFYFQTSQTATYGERSFSNGLSTFKIPVLVGRRLELTRNVSFSPRAGISWLTSQRTGLTGTESGSYASFGQNSGVVEYTAEHLAISKNKFMTEIGMDLNINLYRNIDLALGAQYALGLQTMEKSEVSYQINQGSTYTGTVNSKGSGWKFNAGLTFPLVSW